MQSGTSGMFFGFEYDKEGTGLWDRFANEVVEAFGGAHDFLNHYIGFGYGEDGFTYQNPSFGHRVWTNVMNVINIPLSSPLAFNNMVTPEMAVWLQDYYDSLGRK